MEKNYLILASILAGLAAAAFIYGLVSRIIVFFSGENKLPAPDRDETFLLMLVAPFAVMVEQSKGMAKELAECRSLLNTAGKFWGGMTASEVIASRFLMIPAGFLWGGLMGAALGGGAALSLLLGLIAALVLRCYPMDALKRQAAQRQKEFVKHLPGALDMLLISGRAGMDLRNSILYLADNYIPGTLTEEIQRVRSELAFGASLSDSLMNMAARINVTEVTSLVVALTQALETGTSISDILATITADLRRRRLLGAREEAQTAAVKIAFPMLLLIIPGIFIVLLGPVILKLSATLMK